MGQMMAGQKTASYCTFRVGGRLFGADILDVKEINTESNFTPIHHAPEQVEAYVNIRGRIYLLLNMARILGFEELPRDKRQRLVLFKESVGPDFGILVDAIGDIVEVPAHRIEDRRKSGGTPPEGVERRAPHVGSGVCKLKNELMVILSSKNILSCVFSGEKQKI
jgi:purine-binding chemotaxis protein CheW